MASIAEDPKFHLALTLEPGDLEIIHNPTIFHARDDIHDGEVCQPHRLSPGISSRQPPAARPTACG